MPEPVRAIATTSPNSEPPPLRGCCSAPRRTRMRTCARYARTQTGGSVPIPPALSIHQPTRPSPGDAPHACPTHSRGPDPEAVARRLIRPDAECRKVGGVLDGHARGGHARPQRDLRDRSGLGAWRLPGERATQRGANLSARRTARRAVKKVCHAQPKTSCGHGIASSLHAIETSVSWRLRCALYRRRAQRRRGCSGRWPPLSRTMATGQPTQSRRV